MFKLLVVSSGDFSLILRCHVSPCVPIGDSSLLTTGQSTPARLCGSSFFSAVYLLWLEIMKKCFAAVLSLRSC